MTTVMPDPIEVLLDALKKGKEIGSHRRRALVLLVALLHDERKLTTFLEPVFSNTSPVYGRAFAEHAAKNLRATLVAALAREDMST